jgi:hypothetical protein
MVLKNPTRSCRCSPASSHEVAPGQAAQARPAQDVGFRAGRWESVNGSRAGWPGTPLLQFRVPKPQSLASRYPSVEMQFGRSSLASGSSPANLQKVSTGALSLSCRGQSGTGRAPGRSGHHAKAPGNPPPQVATAATESHLGRLLEDGVHVVMEPSRALEVGHCAHGPRHLLALLERDGWGCCERAWGRPHSQSPCGPLGPVGIFGKTVKVAFSRDPQLLTNISYCGLRARLGLCLSRPQLMNFQLTQAHV